MERIKEGEDRNLKLINHEKLVEIREKILKLLEEENYTNAGEIMIILEDVKANFQFQAFQKIVETVLERAKETRNI